MFLLINEFFHFNSSFVVELLYLKYFMDKQNCWIEKFSRMLFEVFMFKEPKNLRRITPSIPLITSF